MKKEFAISIGLGLVLLIALMPYASATTSAVGPYVNDKLIPSDTVPTNSRFTVQVKTDRTVEAAHVNITFPLGLRVDTITENPAFALHRNQSSTTWVDIIVAEKLAFPTAPTLAEIGFTATQEGNHTINISSVINGEADTVVNLTITVIAVPGDVTGDGRVDYRDIVEVIEHWGEQDTKYDVNRSGTVDYGDISFIVEHWTGP